MAAYYPLPLIRQILKGIQLQQADDQIHRDQGRDNRRAVQLAVYAARPASPESPVVSVVGKCKMLRTKGRTIDIEYNPPHVKSCDFDEYTGKIPPIELVQAAI